MDEQDILRVLAAQGRRLHEGAAKASGIAQGADAAIADAEALLAGLGAALPERPAARITVASPPVLRPWSELVAEAEALCPGEPAFADVLSAAEMAAVDARLAAWNGEFAVLHRLTGFDYAVAGVAGVLAALVDILLVRVPRHPGFLGGPADEGGWLSNVLKDLSGQLLPKETVETLEQRYKVPYDHPSSRWLGEGVEGLGPGTHRLHALGHDPILGWFFGVRDILLGEFTAIGSDGRVVVQPVAGWDPADLGSTVFARLIEAFRLVGGHMLSDVATKAGLPPPFFALAQFFQRARIGEHSIPEITRAMYRSGYGFRHFLAGGVCVALIEVIVRTSWLAREMGEGRSLMGALPVGDKPRLRTKLLLAHSVAAAVNAGKVAVTRNPLSLNWAQWLAFFRYLMPQLHWLLVEKDNRRAAFVQARLDQGWADLDTELAGQWRRIFGDAEVVAL